MEKDSGFQVQGVIRIGNQQFKATIAKRNIGVLIRFIWYNKDDISIMDFIENLGDSLNLNLKDIFPFDFEIRNAGIILMPKNKNILFTALITGKDSTKGATIKLAKKDDTFGLGFILETPILFKSIPLMGKAASDSDGFSSFSFYLQKSKSQILYRFEAPYTLGNNQNMISIGSDSGLTDSEEAIFGSDEQEHPSNNNNSTQNNKNTISNTDKKEEITNANSVNWVSLNKSIGPFTFKKIGFNTKKLDNSFYIYLYLDISFSMSVLEVSMKGLNLGVPLSALIGRNWSELKKMKFGMQGLGILFQNDVLTIGGCLIRTEGVHDRYDGIIIVQIQKFSLTAIGSYTTTDNGSTSLFIYVCISYPLGGPPAFFITGLAAGFGINRGLRIPPIEKVPEFPLLMMMRQKKKDLNIDEAISDMGNAIYVQQGQNFIAAGISFTTFEMLQSEALVTVEFGKEFIIHILGLSRIQLPQRIEHPFFYAELALKACIAPSKGFYSFEAVLTEESYLFNRSCHLSGGFAFYLWTKGEHKGDFVVTLGGYHPKFKKPNHYPDVPRVGINWNINNNLSLKGGIYFALTPTAIMAGGNLDFLFDKGNLKAWFHAGANF